MNIHDLTPEQMEKARACKTPDEVLALAKEEGYELSDEELKSVAGGEDWWDGCVGPSGYSDPRRDRHVPCFLNA